MCIIASKAAGVEMPEQKYIDNMFARNPDGAGLMYAANGMVHIEKGFMKKDDFMRKLKELEAKYDMKELPLVMHFRITTHGGTKPENCHPFPVSDSKGLLRKLKLKTDVGVAHNGIIDISVSDKTLSDTMEYIRKQLAPLKRAVPAFYKSKDLMEMVYNAIDSKMCIMDADGNLYYIGKFEEEKGVKYSNTSFRYGGGLRDFPYTSSLYNYNWNCCTEEGYETWDYRFLMWLDEAKGEYVTLPDGTMDAGEFAIDSYGNAYYYDYELDAFVKLPGARAYNEKGFKLSYKADSQMVSREYVIVE